jgi:hypothetical protein
MPILNIQVDSIGQSGVLPKIIYILTSDNAVTIENPGYLNAVVEGGISLSQLDIALVSTVSPSAVGFYGIVHSNGNWSLSAGSASAGTWLLGGNNSVSNPQVLGTLTASGLSIVANDIEYLYLDPSSQTLDVNASNFKINSSVVSIPNISSATGADILYYNATSKSVTYGATPSLVGAWVVSGNTGVGNVLGSNDTNSWSMIANGTPFVTITSNGISTYSGGVQFNGSFNVNSPDPIVIETSAGLFINPVTATTFETTNGSITINAQGSGANLYLYAGDNNVYINANYTLESDTENIIQRAVQAIYMQAGGGPITVLSQGSNVVLSAVAGQVTSSCAGFEVASTADITMNGVSIALTTSSTFVITGITSQTGTVAAPTHTPPLGYSYLAINSAGNVIQFAA